MTFNVLTRRLHYWLTAVLAAPLLVVLGSGLLLQTKKHVAWVQPAEQRGTGTVPVLDFDGILSIVRQVPDAQATGWQDIARLDVRPDRGLVKVLLRSGWEVQVDLGSGRVLQSSYRRSDLIESLHDGSFFAGEISRLGVFLPAGLALLGMYLSGLWMFWVPIAGRRRRRQRSSPATPGA
jgi:uncharacterized iron-regulated membrane protein